MADAASGFAKFLFGMVVAGLIIAAIVLLLFLLVGAG